MIRVVKRETSKEFVKEIDCTHCRSTLQFLYPTDCGEHCDADRRDGSFPEPWYGIYCPECQNAVELPRPPKPCTDRKRYEMRDPTTPDDVSGNILDR